MEFTKFFRRSHGKPACRDHKCCVNITQTHWQSFDHPSNHPFLECDSPESKKREREESFDVCEESEPLEVGQSTSVEGSTGNSYVITRHPDKNGEAFYWCTCPSRKFHGTKGDNSCKHIMALRDGAARKSAVPRTVPRIVPRTVSRTVAAPKVASATTTSTKSTFPVALAEKYEPNKHNPVGMVFMEKFDGFYAHYDAHTKKMFTRQGNELFLPGWLIGQMPDFSVTGELYGGKGNFNMFQGLFNSNDPTNQRWKDVKFMIFDVVDDTLKTLPFVDRMQLVKDYKTANVETVVIEVCQSKAQLEHAFQVVVTASGEGLMLRKNVAYKAGRSTDLLKYKKCETIDGKVVGYKPGTGRFASYIGSVILETRQGKRFNCVPPDRTNPPALGTIVEIECFEITAAGAPRHPRWKCVRTDVNF